MTTAAMTAPIALPAPDTAPAPRLLGLRSVLIIMALFEAYEGLSNVSTLFGDMSEIPGPGFGGFLIKAHIAAQPVLALAALLFAVTGRVRYAIIALAANMIMNWLNYMPSAVLHGLDFGGISTFITPAQMIGFPLMAACAIGFAAGNQRLGIATVLVSIPTLFNLFFVIAFAISVAIYGF
jgi:hypothetical protein